MDLGTFLLILLVIGLLFVAFRALVWRPAPRALATGTRDGADWHEGHDGADVAPRHAGHRAAVTDTDADNDRDQHTGGHGCC